MSPPIASVPGVQHDFATLAPKLQPEGLGDLTHGESVSYELVEFVGRIGDNPHNPRRIGQVVMPCPVQGQALANHVVADFDTAITRAPR